MDSLFSGPDGRVPNFLKSEFRGYKSISGMTYEKHRFILHINHTIPLNMHEFVFIVTEPDGSQYTLKNFVKPTDPYVYDVPNAFDANNGISRVEWGYFTTRQDGKGGYEAKGQFAITALKKFQLSKVTWTIAIDDAAGTKIVVTDSVGGSTDFEMCGLPLGRVWSKETQYVPVAKFPTNASYDIEAVDVNGKLYKSTGHKLQIL
jgi:VCBS repeat-containing protein